MAQKTILQIENVTSNDLIAGLTREMAKVIDAKIAKLQPPIENDPFISRKEIAEMYNVTVQTVHNWTKAGILNPYKIGIFTRYRLSEVKAAAVNVGSKKELSNA
jgi:hypothetical protein